MKDLEMSQNNDIQASLDRIVEAMAEMAKEQKEQGKTLAVNTVSLQEHMRRTELLESAYDKTNMKLEPIIKHVDSVNLVLKIMGVIGSILVVIATLKQAGII